MYQPPFTPGQIVANKQIMANFRCACEGGIRPANATNSVVLVLNHTKINHADDWHGSVLWFRGSGAKGDQTIDKGRNKTLLNAFHSDRPVYLFEVSTPGEYTFRGRVELADVPFQQPSQGRMVWIFPIRLAQPGQAAEDSCGQS